MPNDKIYFLLKGYPDSLLLTFLFIQLLLAFGAEACWHRKEELVSTMYEDATEHYTLPIIFLN